MQDCQWFKDKVRGRDDYAQNLYAAMCNIRWQPTEVFPILKDEYWSASWRSAGGIVANLRGGGDYMDYYCSGMGGFTGLIRAGETEEESQTHMDAKKFVPEGIVTDEIAEDLLKLGWIHSEWPENKTK